MPSILDRITAQTQKDLQPISGGLYSIVKSAAAKMKEFRDRRFVAPEGQPIVSPGTPEARAAIDRTIQAMGGLGRSIMAFPGQPIQEALEKRGTAAPLAFAAGLAADIATPGPGGEVKKAGQAFEGLKNLSTKLLEKFRGMPETVTQQQFNEVVNRAAKEGIRKADNELINASKVVENGRINLTKTAAKVEENLVPLTPTEVKMPRYSRVGEDVIGDGKYGEVVYQSPIKTSAGGVHFTPRIPDRTVPRFNRETGRVEPTRQKRSESFPNYFSHVRYEDMADGKTRKILETQSDLMQKENFASEFGRDADEAATELRDYVSRGISSSENAEKDIAALRERNARGAKLQPYSSNDPLAQLRTFREEVKRAAKDGKDTILIPSGETAMKIEGLGQVGEANRWTTIENELLKQNNMSVGGGAVDGIGNEWIITDVLGDGKFKAVPYQVHNDIVVLDKKPISAIPESRKETFDISGKADTSHFVYKLNESAIPKEARKMGLVVDGKVKADGGEWWKIRVPKERARMPVEAFGAIPIIAGLPQEQQDE